MTNLLPALRKNSDLIRSRTLLFHSTQTASAKKELNNKRLRNELGIIAKLRAQIVEQLRLAGLPERELKKIFKRMLFGTVVFIILACVSKTTGLILFIPWLLVIELLILKRKFLKRSNEFERDYTAMLLALASSIRTGLDPTVALAGLYQLFPNNSVMRLELLQFKDNIDRGLHEERAVNDFASTTKAPDLDQFKVAFVLARKEGSSLSTCLERLARVTRHRQSFRRKVKSAVAMQKLSAIGIAGCTVVIGLIQFGSNPEAMRATIAHPMGSKILLLGCALVVIGLIWMSRLVKPRM